MTRRRSLAAVLVALAATALLAACSSSSGGDGGGGDNTGHSTPTPSELNGQHAGKYAGVGLVPPRPRPSFQLTDTSGHPFSFGTTTAKHPTLLYYGYTHCPDVCPTTMADVSQALAQLPASLVKQVYVVFVTTDVKRDSGAVISQWLGNFHIRTAHLVGLTGSQAQIDAAQAAAHITLAEDDGQTHSAQVLLYGADDYARVSFLQSNTMQQQMIHDLPLVAKR